MRLFVALSLPDLVREHLSFLAGGLQGARWTAPENFHLTLRFIGEVNPWQAEDLDSRLQDITFDPFDLNLRSVGTFGDKRRLRILWVGIEANEALNRLQAKIEQAVQSAGLSPEHRRFKPHVTLARFRTNPPEHRLNEYLARNHDLRIGPIRVASFHLYSSVLTEAGPIYAQETSYPDHQPGFHHWHEPIGEELRL